MTETLFDLAGRVAIVTGGGMGLGQAMALGLAQSGADVAVADLDLAAATETVTQIRASGRRACAITCDVTNPDDITHLFDQTDEELGPIEILVNNAGLGSHTRPEDVSLAEWQQVIQAVIDNPQLDSGPLTARFLTGIPMNRLGEPADLVGPVVFLASDASALVTGVALPVDGGNLALNAGGSHTW